MSTAPPLITSLFSLEGLTAIVTGGTGGLGQAMALALAEGGADVISVEMPKDPNSTSLAEAVDKAGSKLTKFECDVGNSKALRSTFDEIWKAGHEADILLNCAGIQRRGPAEEFDDDTIDEVFNVNLKATFVACQEFAKHVLPRTEKGGKRAKIINIGSIISFVGGNNIGAYAATKGGVLQCSKAFSSEWASRGINVNVICPGYYKTEMTRQYSEDPKYKHFNDYVLSRTPMGRWGEPQDLKGAVVFLASKASDFVSGLPLIVDGGFISK